MMLDNLGKDSEVLQGFLAVVVGLLDLVFVYIFEHLLVEAFGNIPGQSLSKEHVATVELLESLLEVNYFVFD